MPGYVQRMTADDLTRLTQHLLDGSLSREEVARAAWAARGPEGPVPLIQEPGMQLELMLFNAAMPADPEAPGAWWFREVDFERALLELRRSPERIDLGEGWQQVWVWPEGCRTTWILTLWPTSLDVFERRGGRPLRQVADQVLGARADVVRPGGLLVGLLWAYADNGRHLPPSHVMVMGEGPVRDGVLEVLGMLEVDLDDVQMDLMEGPVDVDVAALVTGTHRVLRLDDNGNTFQVGRYATAGAAEAVARRFEARGHKQTYWVEPA